MHHRTHTLLQSIITQVIHALQVSRFTYGQPLYILIQICVRVRVCRRGRHHAGIAGFTQGKYTRKSDVVKNMRDINGAL